MTENTKNLKVIFLGGIGEIGKNMTALEYGNDIIVIDSGLAFPDSTMPGIDLIVQDITYLIQNKSKVKGIFLTHGHEDHIGALPYNLPELNVPVYGTRLTLGLVESKLKEFKKINYTGNSVKAGSVIQAGKFSVEFVSVTHSIPGASALVITTPIGVVVHSGDFKIDLTPIGNDSIDLIRLAEIGKKGVQLLLCESTNAERNGYSMSEKSVGKTLDDLFNKYKDKRLFMATFSSNVARVQQAMDLSKKYGRKIAVSGRSMINVIDTAMKLGELKCDKQDIIDLDKIDKYADKELLIITTGSQGEAMSALTRMASDNFNKVTLSTNDVIIISASQIPGNEKAINDVINKLIFKGCDVIYDQIADVHVSGHAYKDELKVMHSLLKPKFFIPIHGEYKHLKAHKELAIELGMEERNIFIPSLGAQIEVNRNFFKHTGYVPAGERLVDGTGVGDSESMVLRDRKAMSEDGLCIIFLNVSVRSGEVLNGPEFISRGFIYQDEASELITEAKEMLLNMLHNMDLKGTEVADIKLAIKKTASGYFFRKTRRKPMIIAIVNYV